MEYGRNPRGFLTRDGRWQELVLMRLELEDAGARKKMMRGMESDVFLRKIRRLMIFGINRCSSGWMRWSSIRTWRSGAA